MLYINTGLYLEDKEPGRVRYLSQTDPLDAWVLYDRGMREAPATKPRQHLGVETRVFVETLCAERPPGRAAAGATMLEMSSEAGEKLFKGIRQARARAIKRGKVQRCTYAFTESPQTMLILAALVPDGEGPPLLDHLRLLVAERREEFGVDRVLAFAIRTSSNRPYDALVVGEPSFWQLPDESG